MRASRTRPIGFLIASAGLHLLTILLLQQLAPQGRGPLLVRVRRMAVPRRLVVSPLRPRPPLPVQHGLIERLRTDAAGPAATPDHGDAFPVPELPAVPVDVELSSTVAEGRPAWEAASDTLPLADLLEPQPTDLPLAFDLVELDAIRRTRTVAIVDPATGKLERAYLHLPAYVNAVDPRCPYHGGAHLEATGDMMARGRRLPDAAPITLTIHWRRLGGCIRWPAPPLDGFPNPDPAHRFPAYPRRHILHHTEMREHPLLHLDYVDVESLDALTEYLLDGGFAVVNGQQLGLCYAHLVGRRGHEVVRTTLTLGHPIFHSYFDITAYSDANRFCPALGPVSALQIDGRVVAVVGVRFVLDAPCPSNRIVANLLAYGLTQPSAMGGRYRSLEGGASGEQDRAPCPQGCD